MSDAVRIRIPAGTPARYPQPLFRYATFTTETVAFAHLVDEGTGYQLLAILGDYPQALVTVPAGACQVVPEADPAVVFSDDELEALTAREALAALSRADLFRWFNVQRRARAGLLKLTLSRRTHTVVGVYKAADALLDTAGGAYVAVCENHGTLCNFETYASALGHAPYVDWCESCMARSRGEPNPYPD